MTDSHGMHSNDSKYSAKINLLLMEGEKKQDYLPKCKHAISTGQYMSELLTLSLTQYHPSSLPVLFHQHSSLYGV